MPNYNYAIYLKSRLDSIINQSHPIFEIIILDDASTDDSLQVIEQCLLKTKIDTQVIKNKHNSKSVFKQWIKAIQLAKGDIIWIAEADDEAHVEFLKKSLSYFDDDDVVMTYTQSKQIDEKGNVLNDTYFDYTNDIDLHKWQNNFVNDGIEELTTALSVKNTIPNVSAVLFRKKNLISAIESCKPLLVELNIAGDWLVYSEMLKQGKLAFIAESLNNHRRHQKSVTVAPSSYARHLAEIILMQNKIKDLIDVNMSLEEKQKSYIKKIFHQFDLDKKTMNPEEHDLVKKELNTLKFLSLLCTSERSKKLNHLHSE